MPRVIRVTRALAIFGALLAPTLVGVLSGMTAHRNDAVIDHARTAQDWDAGDNSTILVRSAGTARFAQ